MIDYPTKINDSIMRGLEYLSEHQLPNGEFMSYYAPDDKMKQWCVPDSIVFFTALIAGSLLKLKSHEKVEEILKLSANFLTYQMSRGGVWNYFTKWNPLFNYCPADADDTVCSSYVLKSLNIDFVNNRNSILSNRNSKGLFYTWFIIRPKISFDKDFLWIMLRELKRPIKSLLFWIKHEGGRNDIDAAVNANILHYIGLDQDTEPIVKYLIEIINQEHELDCDKWYRNPITLYYFISRNYKIANDLHKIKDKLILRIYKYYNEDCSFGSSALETALAISTLINFKDTDQRLDKAIDFLTSIQQSSGCWERNIFFYSGPSKTVGWGSEELTTGFCIEALNNYIQLKVPGIDL